jgi:hypothetical protein
VTCLSGVNLLIKTGEKEWEKSKKERKEIVEDKKQKYEHVMKKQVNTEW